MPVAAILVHPDSREKWSFFAMAFAIYFVSMALLCLPFVFPGLKVGHFNWSGKLLSILVSYLIIFLVNAAAPARRFVTPRQKPGSLRASALITSILLAAGVAFSLVTGGDHSPSLETVLFEATVPGIDEEGVFRAGIMGCLIAASGRGANQANRGGRWYTICVIAVTSTMFGLMHGLHYSPSGYLTFDLETLAITATIGTLLSILTIQSGSILLPVLAHNAANCLSFVF